MHFGLKTTTTDFAGFLKKQNIYNEILDAGDVFASYGVDWSKYEESLSEIQIEEIEEQVIVLPDYLSDHEYDRDGGISNVTDYVESLNNAIQSALVQMIAKANDDAKSATLSGNDIFKDAVAIINFNYTSTVELLFDNSLPILHIHGYFANGDKLICIFRAENPPFTVK